MTQPNVTVSLRCRESHVQYLYALYAALRDRASSVAPDEFALLPDALELIRRNLGLLLAPDDENDIYSPVSIWGRFDQKLARHFASILSLNDADIWNDGNIITIAETIEPEIVNKLVILWDILEAATPGHRIGYSAKDYVQELRRIQVNLSYVRYCAPEENEIFEGDLTDTSHQAIPNLWVELTARAKAIRELWDSNQVAFMHEFIGDVDFHGADFDGDDEMFEDDAGIPF